MASIARHKDPVRYTYAPKPTITVHQLARLMPVLIEIGNRTPLKPWIDGATWASRIEDLDDELRDHFSPSREEVQEYWA